METKSKDIEITSISACHLSGKYTSPTVIFGLGSDGRIYFWSEDTGKWYLNVKEI